MKGVDSFGLKIIYATINAAAALIPIALFAPRFGKKVATNTATRAKHTGGINDLYPYLSALSRVSLAVGMCLAAGFTKPKPDNTARRTTIKPVIQVGIYGPTINVTAIKNQKIAVVTGFSQSLLVKALNPVAAKIAPITQ